MPPPIGQRVVFADAAQSRAGSSSEIDADSPAAREIAALAAEIARIVPMSERSPKRGFAARPGDRRKLDQGQKPPIAVRQAPPTAFTARLTIDVTPELRGRIKVVAFQRGVTVADMLRDLLAREFPHHRGEHSMTGNAAPRVAAAPRRRRIPPTTSPMSN